MTSDEDFKEMAAYNLKSMDVDALLALRGDIDETLEQRSRDLRKQLSMLDTLRGRAQRAGGAGRASALKGVKVAPKFRGPNGETWAGRGAQPKWLTALLAEGHDLAEFAIGGAVEVAEATPVAPARKARKGARR